MINHAYLQQKYIVGTYANRGLTFVEGEGVYLKDVSGEKYLDMMSNYGVSIFGYGHPELTPALISQLNKLMNLHGSFISDQRAEAAQALIQRCGSGLSQVYWANSGTEAVEAALKFAVLSTGKKKFVSCRNSYHGKTLGSLSAMGQQKYSGPFEPLLWDFRKVDYDCLGHVEEACDTQTAAFLVEPIQGESGIIVPSPGYLSEAKKICEQREVLLILDEIQTGAGRTGRFLASQAENISYDIVCLGKGLAGGLPVGATLVSSQVSSRIPRHIHTSTFGGNPLAAAGIAATLKLLDESVLEHIRDMGNYFLGGLRGLRSGLIKEVRGRGLMLGVEVLDKRNDILQRLQKEKILAIPAADHVVRFLPPYVIHKSHIDQCLGSLERIFLSL